MGTECWPGAFPPGRLTQVLLPSVTAPPESFQDCPQTDNKQIVFRGIEHDYEGREGNVRSARNKTVSGAVACQPSIGLLDIDIKTQVIANKTACRDGGVNRLLGDCPGQNPTLGCAPPIAPPRTLLSQGPDCRTSVACKRFLLPPVAAGPRTVKIIRHPSSYAPSKTSNVILTSSLALIPAFPGGLIPNSVCFTVVSPR